jgi:hypothetical protein
MFQAQRQKRIIGTPIAILTLSGLLAPCANSQNAAVEDQLKPQPMAAPHSGALVGLTSGQTLWIAPSGEKIQVLVAPDYVIPRKDGFWRVRLDINWNDPTLSGTSRRQGRLWAVPLKKGRDAVAWPTEQAGANTSEEENKPDEGAVEDMQRDAEKEGRHVEPLFLSPEYLSFYDEHVEVGSGGSTSGSETYTILKILGPPTTPGMARDQLFVEEIHVPVSDEIHDKDLRACVRADDAISDSDKEWAIRQESTLGIGRDNQTWAYKWLIGGGADLSCQASISLQKNIVGSNELFPEWKQIKSAYPTSEDAFSSPAHDLLPIVTGDKLIVVPVYGAEIGKPLGLIPLTGKPVMVQWAIGKHVDTWTKELAQYFDIYHM